MAINPLDKHFVFFIRTTGFLYVAAVITVLQFDKLWSKLTCATFKKTHVLALIRPMSYFKENV